MTRVHALKAITLAALVALNCLSLSASTRTLEMHFALSSDLRSEFSARFSLPASGNVVLEAEWKPAPAATIPPFLTLLLIRPDGSIASKKVGTSGLQIQHTAIEQGGGASDRMRDSLWTVKILNDADPNRNEIAGTLRITVPTDSRILEDTQFTLLGSGNAQEIPFSVPGPGRIELEASWQPDSVTPTLTTVPLTVSFIHPGEARTYARRQGTSPIRFDHQVTDQALDRGARWIVRVQNDSQTKVKGRIKVTYYPSL